MLLPDEDKLAMADIIEMILDGIFDIIWGSSGKVDAERNDRLRKVKSVSVVMGVATLCVGVLALLIWLTIWILGRIV